MTTPAIRGLARADVERTYGGLVALRYALGSRYTVDGWEYVGRLYGAWVPLHDGIDQARAEAYIRALAQASPGVLWHNWSEAVEGVE
jgi:hypothetical protein